MEPLDVSKEYGLVLEGGGAKAAYQIGVWKALREYGIKIKGISGVSAGALNGALICMGDYDRAERVWSNMEYSRVLNVNNEQMEKLMEGKFREIDLAELTRRSAQVLKDRGLDAAPLKQWIEELVDEEAIRRSPIEFILGTFSLSRFRELELDAKHVEPGLLTDFLLASSYFPAFKRERLHGEKFLDGGMVNNVPVDMLIKRGYQDILVIRVFGPGLEKKVSIPEGVTVTEIAPKAELGNVLEFDGRRSRRNIKIGYFDGLRCVLGLGGWNYYLRQEGLTEEQYLKKLLSMPDWMQPPGRKENREMQAASLRERLETALPGAARAFRLPRSFSYQELYLTFLEYYGIKMRIPKYKVYTEDELLLSIIQKAGFRLTQDGS